MLSLRDRFALADRLEAPMLWERVEARADELRDQPLRAPDREIDRTRMVAAVVAMIVFLGAGAFLWETFARSEHRPETTPPPTFLSDGPSIHLAGVPFGVCNPMSIPGSFGEGLNTVWLFQHASADGCFSPDGSYLGIGTSDRVTYLGEQITDRDLSHVEYLWPLTAADVNGDAIDEVALGAGSNGETPTRFALFRLTGSSIIRMTWCRDCGALVDWAGPGIGIQGSYEGAFCHEHDGSPVFTTWNVELSDDRTKLGGWSIDYSLQGSKFEEVARRMIDIPADTTDLLPPGGGSTLCGSPVHPAREFISYAR